MLLRKHTLIASIFFMLGATSCATSPTSLSANQNSRVSIVVIHFTTANFGDSMRILTKPSQYPVSSHYLIPEPGDETYDKSKLAIYQLVEEDRRAWHAGTSYWAGKSGLNDQSIGIELVNQAWCHASEVSIDAESGHPESICFYPDFADSQIALLVGLLDEILERHPDVKPTHIIGHSDIAPGRKIDPGPRFPWQRLASLGYGAWFDDATVIRYWERFLLEPLPIINLQQALSAWGYEIDPTGENDLQTGNVIQSFQLHFRASNVSREMDVESAAILFALLEKYYPEQVEDLLLIVEPAETGEEVEAAAPLDSGNTL